jgi:hypothetical protein
MNSTINFEKCPVKAPPGPSSQHLLSRYVFREQTRSV